MNLNQQKYEYSPVPTVGFSNPHGQVFMPPQPGMIPHGQMYIPPTMPGMMPQGQMYMPAGPGVPGVPGMMQWMPLPNPIPGCPPGLEYLSQIDRLLVKQKVELLEAFTGWETSNKYAILNAAGQQVYYAFEESDTCMRLCCGAKRSFIIHIVNNMNQEVLRVCREFKCFAGCVWCAGCCDCCAHEVQVSLPNGEVLGYVKQVGSLWAPSFEILDADMKKVLDIEGPCCICNGPVCPCENSFEVIGSNGANIGKVAKVYSGFVQEMFTDADNFCIEFPQDLHINVKATLTGALFLIDFMFFEQNQNNNAN